MAMMMMIVNYDNSEDDSDDNDIVNANDCDNNTNDDKITIALTTIQ